MNTPIAPDHSPPVDLPGREWLPEQDGAVLPHASKHGDTADFVRDQREEEGGWRIRD